VLISLLCFPVAAGPAPTYNPSNFITGRPAMPTNNQPRVRHEQTPPITSIKVGHRQRKDLGDLDLLAESLETVGLLHPVDIDAKNRLIAGQRGLKAAKLLGWKPIPARDVNLEAITLGDSPKTPAAKISGRPRSPPSPSCPGRSKNRRHTSVGCRACETRSSWW
jgi:hypothetical protein